MVKDFRTKASFVWIKTVALLLSVSLLFSSTVYYVIGYRDISYADVMRDIPLKTIGNMRDLVVRYPEHESVMRGIEFHVRNPWIVNFYFDLKNKKAENEGEVERMIKYFLGFLAISQDKLWVNLSPYEKNRVLPDELSHLDIGRDLLVEDYMLKKVISALTDPRTKSGKHFWKEVYSVMGRVAKDTNVQIDTFSKIWIVPDEARVCEYSMGSDNNGKTIAFIEEAKLKVMMEEDYVALQHNRSVLGDNRQSPGGGNKSRRLTNDDQRFIGEIFRHQILPIIEKQVNEADAFVLLRQLYRTLILAMYFKQKQKIRNDFLSQCYFDHNTFEPIKVTKAYVKDVVYTLYVNEFRHGAYSRVRKEKDFYSNRQVVRRYFSGGANLAQNSRGENFCFQLRQGIPRMIKRKERFSKRVFKFQPVRTYPGQFFNDGNKQKSEGASHFERNEKETQNQSEKLGGIGENLYEFFCGEFGRGKKKIIQKQAQFVVDLFLRDKDQHEKERVRDELVSRVHLGTVKNMFELVGYDSFIKLLKDHLSSFFLLVMAVFMGYSSLWYLLILGSLGIFTSPGFFIFKKALALKAYVNPHGDIFMNLFLSYKQFPVVLLHEMVHGLGSLYPEFRDMPLASCVTALFDCYQCGESSKKSMAAGKLLMKSGLSAQDRWHKIKEISLFPNQEDELFYNGAKHMAVHQEVEPLWTALLGAFLAGMGEEISRITGNPGDKWEYVYLLGWGKTPVEAEEIILDFRQKHEQYHREGNFYEVISDIGEEMRKKGYNVFRNDDGNWDLRKVLAATETKTIILREGKKEMMGSAPEISELRLEEVKLAKGGTVTILIVVDNRFQRNHAGRRRLALYSKDEAGVVHERSELIAWLNYACVELKMSMSDVSNGMLNKWIEENNDKAKVLEKEFHEAAQKEEEHYVRTHGIVSWSRGEYKQDKSKKKAKGKDKKQDVIIAGVDKEKNEELRVTHNYRHKHESPLGGIDLNIDSFEKASRIDFDKDITQSYKINFKGMTYKCVASGSIKTDELFPE